MTSSLARRFVSLVPLMSLVAFGGCGAEPVSEADALGDLAQPLSQTVGGPVQGECSNSLTLQKVSTASGPVIRGTCTITCKKKGYSLGTWNLNVYQPKVEGGGNHSELKQSFGSGTTHTTTVEIPYVPGEYTAACLNMWKEKSNGVYFRSGTFPYQTEVL